MSDPTYFADGYTKDGYIKAVPGLYGGLNFKYRPVRRHQFRAYRAEIGNLGVKEAEALCCKMLIKQLLSWDNKHGGKDLPINQDSLQNMPALLLTRLESIVTQMDPSDLPETATGERVDEFIASLDDDQEGTDAKNSQTV